MMKEKLNLKIGTVNVCLLAILGCESKISQISCIIRTTNDDNEKKIMVDFICVKIVNTVLIINFVQIDKICIIR